MSQLAAGSRRDDAETGRNGETGIRSQRSDPISREDCFTPYALCSAPNGMWGGHCPPKKLKTIDLSQSNLLCTQIDLRRHLEEVDQCKKTT